MTVVASNHKLALVLANVTGKGIGVATAQALPPPLTTKTTQPHPPTHTTHSRTHPHHTISHNIITTAAHLSLELELRVAPGVKRFLVPPLPPLHLLVKLILHLVAHFLPVTLDTLNLVFELVAAVARGVEAAFVVTRQLAHVLP